MCIGHFVFKVKGCVLVGALLFSSIRSLSQTYVYAQLQGSPVNTTGWSLAGSATVGNITGTGNSEILLCPAQNTLSGAIFFNQPINLSNCRKWTAEFDFRMFDGTAADGIAFCFLDVPPSGFVTGGGLGIPGTANGLKICFDSYLNCPPTPVPKIEMRWGAGYNECGPQPTRDNADGAIGFIRSANYNHAKITYNDGAIEVFVNNISYLTGFQQFNFTGYLGFTASTGGLTDNHSIKNVVIYTDMPPSIAGAGATATICSGQQLQLGTVPNASYLYTWTPATDLSATTIANPTVTIANTTGADITRKYYVQTAFANVPGCASIDSITVTVKRVPAAAVTISSSGNPICAGTNATFTAAPVDGGPAPVYQWKVNGANAGTNSPAFSSTLANGDIVSCTMTSNEPCIIIPTAISNSIIMTVNPVVTPAVSIAASGTTICQGSNMSFTATPVNGGTTPSYQWKVNGVDAGTNSPAFSSSTLTNGSIISCVITNSETCVTTPAASSNSITVTVNPVFTPAVSIAASSTDVCQGNNVSFTATPVNGGTSPSYQWKVNGTNVGANSAAFSTNSLSGGDVVSCEMTSNVNCALPNLVSSNTIPVTVRERLTPLLTITASKENICIGAVVDFAATTVNGGAVPVYQWKVNGANAGTNSPAFSSNTFANGDIVSCELTSSENCVTSSTALSNTVVMNVSAFVTPSVSISSSATTICRGDEVVFNAIALHAGLSPVYQWQVNGMNAGTNDPVFSIRGLSDDDEVVCVMTPGDNACSMAGVFSNPITITINPLPVITILPADTIVKWGSQVQLNAFIEGNFISYEWSPGLTNISSLTPVTIPLNATGDYWLLVVSGDGCPVSKQVTVRVFNKLLMPNAFTPNNDGLNDVFRIPRDVPLTLKNFSIYDRWGQRVFFTTDINKGWNGTVRGVQSPSGVYVYMVNGMDETGPVFLKGTFVLIR